MSDLGRDIKKLGFGLMRLPKLDEKTIDVEQTKQMVDMFMDAGFTYFDTAWAYAGSEDAIRQALVERYPRESFQLATKNAAWINCKTKEEAHAQFETSLKQTGAGYFDFTCSTTSEKAAQSSSTVLICGTGCRKRSRKASSNILVFPSTLPRKSWRQS